MARLRREFPRPYAREAQKSLQGTVSLALPKSIRTAEGGEKRVNRSRPSLCPMQDIEDDQAFLENLIDDEVRKPCNDEFAGVVQAAVPATVWHAAQALGGVVDSARNPVGRLEIAV